MKSAQEIYEQVCSDFEDSCGILINDSSEMAVRMRAVAEQIYSLYVYNDWVLRQCFPHSAAGEYLDYHAMMRNITRKPAQKAHGQLHFRLETPSDTDTPIPEGTVCMTLSGIEFETIQSAFIAAGEYYADVPARAVNAGSGGNAAQSTIIFMTSPPAGVFACTNLQRFTGGSDEETDEELRKRILSTYAALPSGANTGYYEKLVLDFEEVSAVKVLPKARGLGTVDIVFTSIEGIPDEKLIEEVKQCIEENREICVDADVYAPESKVIDISARIDVKAGYSAEEVRNNTSLALQNYFTGKLFEKGITTAALGNVIYNVDGVSNYELIIPSEDTAVEELTLPVCGEISVSLWS